MGANDGPGAGVERRHLGTPLPEWVQWVGGVAAFVLAVSVIWGKVVKPGASLITLLDELVPLAQELVKEFKDAPDSV